MEKSYNVKAGDLELDVFAIGKLIQGSAYLKSSMLNNECELRLDNLQSLYDLKHVVDSVLRQLNNET